MAPTRNPATGGGRDHALYWISMAWLCNLSLGLLLRNLLYSSDPKNVAGQSRKVLRHERKVRCLSRKRRKSLWLLYLTLCGQTEPIADLQLHPAVHGGDLQPCGEALRRKIMSDKAKAADTLLEPLEQAPGKQAIRLLKPLRLGKRHRDIGQRPLPIVRLKSGEVASTPEEAFQRCKKSILVKLKVDLPPRQQCGLQLQPLVLHVPRKIQSGKAPGPDLIPGEFLKSAGPWIARELWPLLLKICCRIQEPLLFKGRRLATLFKHKGSAAEASNHRALVSSTIGKTMHGCFVTESYPMSVEGSELQFSARRRALVSLGAHIVRLHQRWAKQIHRCDFTIFVDIASAYYSLLRQLAMDVEATDENILALLKRLGYPDCHIAAAAAKLEEPSAMEALQVPPHLRAILGEFHSHTWFRLKNDSSIVATSRGTRPGDSLADFFMDSIL